MSLDDHPNVFRFEGRLWVSALPRQEMHAQLTTQRAWDAEHVRGERWAWAIGVGAVVGCAATIGVGTLGGLAPASYLVLLPLGFGVGTVLGAVVNRWIISRGAVAPRTPRPVLDEVTKVPASVATKTSALTPVTDLIAWSRQGFVP